MAITGNGSNILLYNADTDDVIMCQLGVTVSYSADMIDTTCKQDGGYSTFMTGLRKFSCTCDALVDWILDAPLTTDGIDNLVDAYENRTRYDIKILDSTSNFYFIGDAYVASIDTEAGTEDVAKYTVTFEGTGEFQLLEVV